MTCVELEKSLAEIADGSDAKQQAHLKTCAKCSGLVAELNLIASSSVSLRDTDEPSPRVWNSIEIALRQEGLIRPYTTRAPRTNRSLVPSLLGWARWLAPVAALLVITAGIYVRQHSASEQLARNAVPAVAPHVAPGVAEEDVSDAAIAGLNDDDLLQEVSEQPPATRAQFADNLRRVNEYIRDAKTDVADDPNDDEARRSLLEAYQQKAMLFELAMDRSLP
jgi:hypothetical protein